MAAEPPPATEELAGAVASRTDLIRAWGKLTAPAAAIPMLAYTVPSGIGAQAELRQLAEHIRATSSEAEPAGGAYSYTRVRQSDWDVEERSDPTARTGVSSTASGRPGRHRTGPSET